MTFTQIKQAIKDACLLTSAEADTRVGTAINRHYRRVTSQLGMDATRFVTRTQATTPGGQAVTFTDIEKLDRVLDTTDLTARRLLREVSLHALRAVQPGTGLPTQWALQHTDADAVTILLDTQPDPARSLQADGWTTLADLAGSDEPAFPESFHDVLVWFVIAEELLKKEKLQLAGTYEQKAEKLLADLRFHLADSHTRETRQASAPIGTLGAGGGSGGGLSLHAPTHEAGGIDPIDLGALAGVITLAQLVPHAPTHETGGSDPIDLGHLDGTLPLAQLPAHAPTHEAGSSDEVAVTALGGFPGGTTTFLRADQTFAPAVVGPASSVDDRIATFDGVTGTLIQDGGQTIAEVMAAAPGTPAGSDTQVQFNDGGAFGGDAGLTYDKTTDVLTAGVLAVGTTPATTGAIRLSNAGVVYGRNAANTEDIQLLLAYSDNQVYVGASVSDAGLMLRSATAIAVSRGITFPAVQVASVDANTLDDYEEGTWTPVIGGSGGTSGQSYLLQTGNYIKIGRLVWVDYSCVFTNKGTISGTASLQGLPFQIASTHTDAGTAVGRWANLVGNHIALYANCQASTYAALFRYNASAAANNIGDLVTGNLANNSELRGSLTYLAQT